MQTKNDDIILFAIASTLILLILLSFIAAILFLYQKKSVLYFKQLEDVKNKYEKNLLQTQLEIQEQTFQDISREIHDNIGLSLTLAKLQLNTIDYSIPLKIKESVESSADLISKVIADLSDISKSLNSETIRNQGLYNTLKLAIEKIKRSGKYTIEFEEEGDVIFADAQKELILYRIAQEAFTNILKHAEASRIWIKLRYETDNISLSITDNGKGFDKTFAETSKPGKTNSGLNNIRTRVAVLNGNYYINTQPGLGTSVHINAPY